MVPLIAAHREWLDDHAGGRFDTMCDRYGISAPSPGRRPEPGGQPAP
jgi:hypothetical protein